VPAGRVAGPFGWLLIAEPLSAAEIGKLAEELAQREQYATGDRTGSPGAPRPRAG
jgi:hypothetical protein